MVQPFWKTLAVFEHGKHSVAIRPSNFTAMYILKSNDKIFPHKNLYMNVYSNIIHKSQKSGNNSNVLSTDKQNVVCPTVGWYLAIKRT